MTVRPNVPASTEPVTEERYAIPYGPNLEEMPAHHDGVSPSMGRGTSLHLDEDEKNAYLSPIIPLLPGEEAKVPAHSLICDEELKVPRVAYRHAEVPEEDSDRPSLPLLPGMGNAEHIEQDVYAAIARGVVAPVDIPAMTAALRPFLTNYRIQSAFVKELLEQNRILANNLAQEEARADVMERRAGAHAEESMQLHDDMTRARAHIHEAEDALRDRNEREQHETEKAANMLSKVATDKRMKYTIKVSCEDATVVRNLEVLLDRTLVSSYKQEVTERFGGHNVITFTLKFRSHLAYYRTFKLIHHTPGLVLDHSVTKFHSA